MTDSDTPPGDEGTDGTASDGDAEEQPARNPMDRPTNPLGVDATALPHVPGPDVLSRTLVVVVWLAIAYVLLRGASRLLLDYWFLESLGLTGMFWTNVRTGAVLFAVAGVAFAAAAYLPLRARATTPTVRRFGAHVAAWIGIGAGWVLAGQYLDYLLAFSGGAFGTADYVFGHDVGFYVFVLPAVWTTLWAATALVAVGLLAAVVGQADRLRRERVLTDRSVAIPERIGRLATPAVQGFVAALGVLLGAETLLSRYEVLWRDNTASGVRTGAEYVDVEPFFSTINAIHVTALVILAITAVVVYRLHTMHVHYTRGPIWDRDGDVPEQVRAPNGGEDPSGSRFSALTRRFRGMASVAVVALLVLDLAFVGGVVLTDDMVVQPNEPNVQEPYIREHMDATLTGYQLNDVEVVEWEQAATGQPQDPDTMLESETLQQAPVWPGWVSYLDAPVDPSHVDRVRKTGTTVVYAPVLKNYRQEQQLRPYYAFADVDAVRYTVDGEKRVYTSAVREQPSVDAIGEMPWLRHWTTNRFQYTHGLGLVVSPANEVNPDGSIPYAVRDVPPQTEHPELEAESRIYYGEMLSREDRFNYVFTNAQGLSELDYARTEGRQEYRYPENGGGVPVDSHFKEVVLSVATGDWDVFFSGFIDHESTRVHYYREPGERIRRIAPFLFVDCNAYAVATDGDTKWMVNALTTTDRYPNSFRDVLGEKAEERCPERGQTRVVNYAEDSVKVTVDATTGEVTLYKVADAPVVDAWANVYPELFTPESEMPAEVESHLQYPLQWMHLQFDDAYHRFHQDNLYEFYNSEDLWDDADEVRGSLVGGQKEVMFSYEPLDLLVDPADMPAGSGPPADTAQFVKVKPFTPENSPNLRSTVVVYQDPENYGHVVDLRVPQGSFAHGPEQADSLLDQNDEITSRINLWERIGSEVIRGHTIMLPVGGDLLYLEPIYVESQQAEQPEMRMVVAVYRGEVAFGPTPEDAVRNLGEKFPENATATAGGDPDERP